MQEFRARSYYGLGRCAEAKEDWEAARRLYLSVGLLYDDPDLTPDSLERAAAVMDRLGLSKEAEQARKELLDRYPDYLKKEAVGAVEKQG